MEATIERYDALSDTFVDAYFEDVSIYRLYEGEVRRTIMLQTGCRVFGAETVMSDSYKTPGR